MFLKAFPLYIWDECMFKNFKKILRRYYRKFHSGYSQNIIKGFKNKIKKKEQLSNLHHSTCLTCWLPQGVSWLLSQFYIHSQKKQLKIPPFVRAFRSRFQAWVGGAHTRHSLTFKASGISHSSWSRELRGWSSSGDNISLSQ